MSHETEIVDRRLQKRPDDRIPYQDREAYESSLRYHHGPLQRDWQWENDGFLNARPGNFPHLARGHNNNRLLSNPRGRPGWHLNNHFHYGNPGGGWHPNAGGGPQGWHRGGRGRNPNWNPEGNNGFSHWPSQNSGGNWMPGQPNGNGWNLGRSRAPNNSPQIDNIDVPWLNREKYPWPWQEGNSMTSYITNETNQMNGLWDFSHDQFPSDNLFGISKQPASKVNGKSGSPSREKTSRWTPYPSQKTTEQQLLPEEAVAKISKAADSVHLPPSQPPLKGADLKADPKFKKLEETFSTSSSYKATPSKLAPTECTSQKKADPDESRGNKMPSVKTPLLAISDIKPSSQKRAPKNILKPTQVLLSSAECQSQLNALNIEANNSSKQSNEGNNLKGVRDVHNSNECLPEVLWKDKEELQSSSLQKSYLSPCRNTQTDRNEECNTEGTVHSLKTHEPQTNGLENKCDENLVGKKGAPSNSCASCDPVELSCTAIKKDNCVGELGNADKKYSEFQMDSVELQSNCQHNLDIDLKASLEGDDEDDNGEEGATKSNCNLEEECYEAQLNHELQKGVGGQPSGPLLPELSKLGFPASLQRDLTWRTSSKSKTGSHLPEPNLNSARRIRNVSGHRKSETEKESGLKPTLRQIISASRRNVNWEQVIQQVTKKKQELGKGLPRCVVYIRLSYSHVIRSLSKPF